MGVGVRAILVFFGAWQGKWGGRVFSFFDFFSEGGSCGWAGFRVGVCVKKEAAPLVWVLVGDDGVRQGCTAWLA